jgi:hypothetical protein
MSCNSLSLGPFRKSYHSFILQTVYEIFQEMRIIRSQWPELCALCSVTTYSPADLQLKQIATRITRYSSKNIAILTEAIGDVFWIDFWFIGCLIGQPVGYILVRLATTLTAWNRVPFLKVMVVQLVSLWTLGIYYHVLKIPLIVHILCHALNVIASVTLILQ